MTHEDALLIAQKLELLATVIAVSALGIILVLFAIMIVIAFKRNG